MFMKGEHVGPFVLDRRLTRGLEGEVWRARAKEGGAWAAVKVFIEPAAIQTVRRTGVPRFPAHPYLCAVLASDLQHHLPWVATEFATGPTLREEMAQGRLPLSTAIQRLHHVLRGLAALHRAGVAHHDLRPENVIHDQEHGRARVLDVMTEAAHRDMLARLLTPGHPMPVPKERADAILPYVAPELRKRPDSAVDGPRGDVYAFGVLAYEALTGTRPPESSLETPRPSAKEKKLPKGLDELVARCLERSPRARPANAMGLEAEMDRIVFERPK